MTKTARIFMSMLWLPVFWALSFNCSADPKGSFHLLIVDSQKGEPYQTVRTEMIAELERSGYKVGKNLKIKHYSIGNIEGATKSIWEIERDNDFDAIFITGTVATIGMKKQAFGEMKHKFVFAAVTDPVGIGVIDAFDAPPKANFTGVAYPVKVEERLRFIKQVMPGVKKIGMIDTDMPQSQSYWRWLEAALKQPEFRDLQLLRRTVSFVKSEEGHRRMAELAEKFVVELDPQVDVFLGCNDQLCVQQPYPEMVFRTATKPLVSTGKREVTDEWGATMSIYPDQEGLGQMAGTMVRQLFEKKPISSIIPRTAKYGYAFDLNKTKRFSLAIPPKMIEAAGKNGVKVIYASPTKIPPQK